MDVFERDSQYIVPNYSRFPLAIVGGKGAYAIDDKGKEYIDLGGGIAVNIFGYGDAEWKKAVTVQLNKVQHTSNLFYSEPDGRLAELLCKKTDMSKVFFSNSGAEANECAIKAARKYAADNYGKKKYKIITLIGSFHGRTITTLSATGQEVFHSDFLPLTEGFVYCKPNDEDALEACFKNNDIAAFMFEAVQGEGGVMPLSREFLKAADKLCKKYNALMIADEVQCGNGRSGKYFCYMHYGIFPDIVTTAKGIGGGLPLGVTLFNDKTMDVLTVGTHGSTFGGNPVVCAGAISIVSRIDELLLDSVTEKSKYIIETLSGKSGIKSVSGMGLMLGIETVKDASEVIRLCREKGVIVIKAKNKVRLLPPLNIPIICLEKGLDAIIEACSIEKSEV